MRAVSDSPQLARVSGIRVERVVYVLMDAIRSYLIKRAQLANTRCNTIRLKLLKRMNDRSRLSWRELSCLLTLLSVWNNNRFQILLWFADSIFFINSDAIFMLKVENPFNVKYAFLLWSTVCRNISPTPTSGGQPCLIKPVISRESVRYLKQIKSIKITTFSNVFGESPTL